MNSETRSEHDNKNGSLKITDDVSYPGFNLNLFVTSVADHVLGDLCDLFVYLRCYAAVTSLVPGGGVPAVIHSHSQEDISNL